MPPEVQNILRNSISITFQLFIAQPGPGRHKSEDLDVCPNSNNVKTKPHYLSIYLSNFTNQKYSSWDYLFSSYFLLFGVCMNRMIIPYKLLELTAETAAPSTTMQ